ncbi:hypothetical protein BH11GEM1_BH11GEM1_17930 [soil metagenome]
MTVRTARLSAALLLAAPLAAAPLMAQSEYAAGTTRYRVTTDAKGTQTSPMGNASFDLGLKEQLTVSVMKHARDTVMATIKVDSIAMKSTGAPAPDLSKVTGMQFVTLMSPTGKFYSSKAPEGMDPALGQITDGIGRFLPSFRVGVANGMTWSDTTSGKVSQQGMDMDRTSVSTFKVNGDTTIAGEKAFRIERRTATKAAGSGMMQGTPMTMETTGTGTGAYYLTPKGVYLGAQSSDEVNTKVTVLAQNIEIAIKQQVHTTVEAIK